MRPTVQYSTRDSSHPQSLAVADFNIDGYLDIVVASSGFDNITIFFGHDDISSANQRSYSMGSGSKPRMVAVGDLNGDNRLDIIVANFGTNNIVIVFENGYGSFSSQTTIETSPSRPVYVVVGDLNNDECTDIVFAGYGTNSIGVLLGFCNGTFGRIMYSSTGYDSRSSSIVLGDFNKDGQIDIGITNNGTDNIGIFLGYGNGTFITQTTFTTGINSRPYSIASGDLNNDTYLDITITNSEKDNIMIFLGHGNGSFYHSTSYYTGRKSNPIFITIADFNNDNILDITVVNNGTDKIMLYFGHGDGTFANPKKYSTGPRSSPCAIDVGNFKGDNKLGVAIANEQNNNIKIFSSETTQTFASETTFLTSESSSSIGMSFISIDIDSFPVSLAVGDFNNDDQLDIVVALLLTSSVAVLLGKTNGRFSPPTVYSTGDGSEPQSVIVADFNSDSQLDIAVTSHGTNNVAVFLGYGTGEFSPRMTYSTGIDSLPHGIVAGDFNNDGRLDMAIGNTGMNNVGIFLGYGNGEFLPQNTYFTGNSSRPRTLVAGDFNNDGHLDIVFASSITNTICVLFGYGTSEFSLGTTYDTGYECGPCSVATGDLNNDGQLDIVIAISSISNVRILLGYGNGEFSSQTTYFIGTDCSPFAIVIGDLNSDGCADIAVASLIDGNTCVLFGHGDGGFSSPRVYSIGSGSAPTSIVIDDFNRDNRLDIAVANGGTSNIAILLGQSDGTFPYFTYSTKRSFSSTLVAVGDFDSDGRLDIAVANYDKDNVGVLLGYGNGSFQSPRILVTGNESSPSWIVIADFNNDKHLDIAVANSGTNNIGIFLGYGNGQFSPQSTYSTGDNSFPISLAVSDFNRDGKQDIVVATLLTGIVRIFVGDGNGKFSRQKSYFTGDYPLPISVIVADFNNDHQVDIVALNGFVGTVGILLGHGDGTFQSHKTFSTGIFSNPTSFAVDDLNNDGNVDVVVTNAINLEGHVLILLGDGFGNFLNHVKYLTGPKSRLCSVIIGHFNDDTQLDIAIANNGSREIGVFLGYGDGTFSSQNKYSITDNSYPISLAIGDFNNDNLTDLAVANYGSNILGIFLMFIDTNLIDNTILSTGSAAFPAAVVLGDFTNDGQLDIVVGNDGTHNIGLFTNHGNGQFSLQTAYFGDSTFYFTSMVVHDFNNDGQLDLAIANAATNTLTLLYGNENRTFGDSEVFPTGINSSPQSITTGDFNNDNRTDIAVAYSGSGSVGLHLKIDIGALESMISFSIGSGSKPHGLTVADFDKDGHLDIAVANNEKANIGILFGFGNGSFSEQKTVSIGEDILPRWVDSGDFNNDKQLDIVVSTDMGGSPVIVLLNNDDRSFNVEKTYGITSAPKGAIGDVNNDGYLDVVLCQTDYNTITVVFGRGDGTFRDPMIYSTGAGSYPMSIAVSDFNNDSWLDIAVANGNRGNIRIFLGYGNGTFPSENHYVIRPYGNPISITTGDFNNDSLVDMAVGLYMRDTVGIFLGYGNGTFQDITVRPRGDTSVPLFISTGDFNSDGQLDIVFTNINTSSLNILLGHTNVTFFNKIIYTTGNNSYPHSIGLGDFNNDGRLDVAVSNMFSDSIGIFLGYANENFASTAAKSIGESSQPVSVAVEDLNNDTCLDLIVADRQGNRIVVLQGSGHGTFSSQMNYSTGDNSYPSWVAVNHFNQDQYLDIAVVNSGTNDIGIFLGHENGTFSSVITSSTGNSSSPFSLTVGHFNDDAHVDIAVTNFGTNSVCLLLGYGNGSFESLECHTSSYDSRPFAVASGDVNGDNRTDVVIANKRSSTIEILTKIC